ncbi:membrane protein [Advenella kashmirensis W13003]|uniref:Membrane protein n=1 Tax=Advenella kashmirensis W13003 TaxID=1424334 RepID=V8QQJ5_9BURK|nr:DUF202 domain-containing protein [Advenella kashmirensis]ETF01608.1 membrane protein [Advenella kashmirensis W13003]
MKNSNWREMGEEPDYRFTLANERTFLAWVRTALAILAAGVLLDQFAHNLASPVIIFAIALGLCVLAGVLFIVAYIHWRDVELAMRLKRTLPRSPALGLLALGGMGTALVLVILLIKSFL